MEYNITKEDFSRIKSKQELVALLKERNTDLSAINKRLHYENELKNLQIEMVKLQGWISKNKKRVVIIFEGRDAAGKGGNIRRFKEHLNPRSMNLVALTKPTEIEKGQWY